MKQTMFFRYLTKKYLVFYMLLLCVLFLLSQPQIAAEGARFGLMLWAKRLLPSLLPFLIVTQLLIRSGYLDALTRKLRIPHAYFVLFAGTLFGFPMGCKLTCDLYAHGQLTKKEASLLFIIANQMSPAFVGGYLLSETMQQPQLILRVYLLLYAPSVCYGLLRLHTLHAQTSLSARKTASGLQINFAILDAGIMNSFETMLKLGGYVMLFAILAHMCSFYLSAFPALCTLVSGLLEITGAVSTLAQAIPNKRLCLIAVLAATAFGGCSGLAQTASIVHAEETPAGLSMSAYVRGRILLAAVTALLAALFLP